jgi:signal transduction histidine kinase
VTEQPVNRLYIVHGADAGRVIELHHAVCSIGRQRGNTIRLDDLDVSRRHAELVIGGHGVELRDLGSSNGTFVNGQQVKQRILKSGDQLLIGDTVLVFRTSTDFAPMPPSTGSETGTPSTSRIIKSTDMREVLAEVSKARETRRAGRLEENVDLARAFGLVYSAVIEGSRLEDVDSFLAYLLETAAQELGADRGCILMADDAAPLQFHCGYPSAQPFAISRTMLRSALDAEAAIWFADPSKDERLADAASVRAIGTIEAICVPLLGLGSPLGLLYVDRVEKPQHSLGPASRGGGFRAAHLDLLVILAHQAALAVENTRYQTRLQHASRLAGIGQSIAILSHDVRAILQAIDGAAYHIQQGVANRSWERIEESWRIVARNQETIGRLIENMLEYGVSRVPQMQQTCLNSLAARVVELLDPCARNIQVRIVFFPDAAKPTALIDPLGMERALLNIVRNAVEASAKASANEVYVRVGPMSSSLAARFSVTDFGPGLPQNFLDLPSRFLRSTKGYAGFGLGLHVAEKIVREHGGCLRMESELGKGCTLILEIPQEGCHAAQRNREALTGTEPAARFD